MGAQHSDPLRHVAEQVADCLSARGYAFVEDDNLDTLAATLRSFLTAAGIPVNPVDAADDEPSAVPLSGKCDPISAGRHPASSSGR
jgi:hypothetical protein